MGSETKIKVLHLETAREWRGGQQQIAYLVEGLQQWPVETLLVCPPEARIARFFKEKQLPLYTLPIKHGLDVKGARRIARLVREQSFTIVHAHSSHALSLGLLVKLFVPSVKLVASRRVDFSVKKPLIGALKYRNALVDRIVCISQNIATVLEKDGVPKEKLVVIHSGIDPQRFRTSSQNQLRKTLQIPEDHLVVGTVAALVGHKDYPNLLQAAKLVLEKQPKVTFLAIGSGNDLPALEALKEQLSLDDRFRFLGFRSDLQDFYRLFDVFVLASRKEGLGTSVLDALACGVTVVATRAGGIPEMVQDHENGLLVPPENPEALAQALLRLLNDRALRERLAAQAPASIKSFTVAHMVQKHVELYSELEEQ